MHQGTFEKSRLSPKTVQTFAGHSSLQVTMDRYGHLFKSDDHKKAMDAMETRNAFANVKGREYLGKAPLDQRVGNPWPDYFHRPCHAPDRWAGALAHAAAGFIIQRARRSTLHSRINRHRDLSPARRALPGDRHECIASRLGQPCSLANVRDFCSLGALPVRFPLRELPCRRNRATSLLLHRAIPQLAGSSGFCSRHGRKAPHAHSTLSLSSSDIRPWAVVIRTETGLAT
jgi:hypothetical protein